MGEEEETAKVEETRIVEFTRFPLNFNKDAGMQAIEIPADLGQLTLHVPAPGKAEVIFVKVYPTAGEQAEIDEQEAAYLAAKAQQEAALAEQRKDYEAPAVEFPSFAVEGTPAEVDEEQAEPKEADDGD